MSANWERLPRPNPCLPCMVMNPRGRRKSLPGCGDYSVYVAPHGAAHVDFPGAHAASGRGRTTEVNRRNPWVVLRRGDDVTVSRWGTPTWRALEKQGFVEHNIHETEKGAKAEAYKLRGARKNPRKRGWHISDLSGTKVRVTDIVPGDELEGPRGVFKKVLAVRPRVDGVFLETRRDGYGTWVPHGGRGGVYDDIGEVVIRPKKSRSNPRLMVLNPSANTILEKVERHIGRRLTSAERKNAEQAIREFKQFHGRDPESLIPVDAPPGSPLFLNYVGHETRRDYEVRIGSERKGRWTHKAGDHGRKHMTKPAIIASIPGRKKHNTLTVAPSGAKPFFKPTHGLMG